jgi:hypothetical protein
MSTAQEKAQGMPGRSRTVFSGWREPILSKQAPLRMQNA